MIKIPISQSCIKKLHHHLSYSIKATKFPYVFGGLTKINPLSLAAMEGSRRTMTSLFGSKIDQNFSLAFVAYL